MNDVYSLLLGKKLRRHRMMTQRPFEELNLWQRIFAEHWPAFAAAYAQEHGRPVPEHWRENVGRMLSCGDIREGYHEYQCRDCGTTKKVGFTCKSRLCLRCFKMAVDEWLNQAKKVLFEGVIHRQVVLTVPKTIRPLVLAEEMFLKAYVDAGAVAVKELIAEWRRNFALKRGINPQPYRQKPEERFGKGEMRCPACGSADMLLIRIWTKAKGVVYEVGWDLSARAVPAPQRGRQVHAQAGGVFALPPVYRQTVFAI